MSLFDKPPSEFPFRVNLDRLPVRYTLAADVSDTIVTTLLALFWAVFGSALAYFLSQTVLIEFMASGLANALSALIAASFLAGWLTYIWPTLKEDYRKVHVTLGEEAVEVVVEEPLARRKWSEPLASFEGVAQLNLGHHHLDDGTKQYISSVVLKHPDPEKSVPLVIGRQKEVGAKTVRRLAARFGLPVLEGVGDLSGERAYPDGTLVVNRKKALVVRIAWWAMAALLVAMSAMLVTVAWTGQDSPLWLLLLPVFVACIVGLQVFGRLYVVRMREWQGQIWVRTAGFQFRDFAIPRDRFTGAVRFEGKSGGNYRYGTSTTYVAENHTPWIKLSVKGWWLPLVIDLQAEYVNEKAIHLLPRGNKR